MKSINFYLLGVWLLSLQFHPGSTAAAEPDANNGEMLFLHKWTPLDKLSPDGDGLGPMSNESSCIACHNLGGVGGAGGFDKNVGLLSVRPSKVELSRRNDFETTIPLIHPGFQLPNKKLINTIVLHKFGADENYNDWWLSKQGVTIPAGLTEQRRARLLRVASKKRVGKTLITLPREKGVDQILSQRNTPALFGTGEIDSIPDSEIQKIADLQKKSNPKISGRVPLAEDGVGKFGWRGQISTLREFVLAACANELGLQNGKHNQAINPLDTNYAGPGDDLSDQQADDMVEFVRNIPRPHQSRPINSDHAVVLNYGEKLFNTIGCAVCHVKKVGNVDGIYSDFLLHNMGDNLSDPSPAKPATKLIPSGETFNFRSGYAGGSFNPLVLVTIKTDIFQEWKTPPLWGVANSAPYLHDGRAKTLHEAIIMHGGQASPSVIDYNALPPSDRSMIINFLSSLVAPGNN